MARISYLEIAGKKYPLSFSLMAQKKIAAKYGGLDKIANYMTGDNEETYVELGYICTLLIQQGCAYKNAFEKDVPPYENAPVVNGEFVPLTEDEIMLGVGFSDMKDLVNAIMECMGKGVKAELEAVEKNVESPVETAASSGMTSGGEY